MLIYRTRKLALAVLVALVAAAAGASGAQADTTCKFANAVVEVHMTEHGDRASFATINGTIAIGGDKAAVTCVGGTPTIAATDTVLVVDDSDNLATAAGNDGNTSM